MHRFFSDSPKYWRSFCLTTECLDEVGEVRECAHFYPWNELGFIPCLKRNEYSGNTRSSRRNYRRQNPRKSMQTAIQSEFANEDFTCNSCASDLRSCQKYRSGNGEIKSRARFWKPSGRKSDRNVPVENLQAWSAERTRSRDSLKDASGSPTRVKFTNPRPTCVSTSTIFPSRPTRAIARVRASEEVTRSP